MRTCFVRIVVAPVGSTVVDESGEDISIQKTSVGGVMSEGMLCDARMLGWVGGAEGIAAQIPDSYPLGSEPPATKPRTDNASSEVSPSDLPAVEVKPLFEKKLTKEEKKKLADEKRKAKKAAKETIDTAETTE
jgi:tRNA-binding EMAP/Myf-like protein